MQAMLQPTEHSVSPSSADTRLLGPVARERIADVLPVVMPLLAPAFEQDGWKVGVDDLRRLLTTGGMELWCVFDARQTQLLAAIASEVMEYPKARVFCLAFCGGTELERWAHWISAFDDIARERGCTSVRIAGRKGWGRVFPEYAERARIFEKRLEVE